MTTKNKENAADKVPEGFMKDRKGRLVPVEIVEQHDFEMDEFVKKIVSKARRQQEQLRAFKVEAFDDCYAFLDLLAEKYGRKHGGLKVMFRSLRLMGCFKCQSRFRTPLYSGLNFK